MTPVVTITDEMIDKSVAALSRIFPDSDRTKLGLASTAAFMSMLTVMENGDVAFTSGDGEPVHKYIGPSES